MIKGVIATQGPGLPGYGGAELYDALDDPDLLVEIADWESVEARERLLRDPSMAEAMAPIDDLLAAPIRSTLVERSA